jgi:hypothetical protein
MAILPLESGSGKFDTSCERMHRTNWRPGAMLAAVVLGLLDDPHAASENPEAANAAIVIQQLARMWT